MGVQKLTNKSGRWGIGEGGNGSMNRNRVIDLFQPGDRNWGRDRGEVGRGVGLWWELGWGTKMSGRRKKEEKQEDEFPFSRGGGKKVRYSERINRKEKTPSPVNKRTREVY